MLEINLLCSRNILFKSVSLIDIFWVLIDYLRSFLGTNVDDFIIRFAKYKVIKRTKRKTL